jgi:hypothetical protein
MRGGAFVYATEEWLERLSTVAAPLALSTTRHSAPRARGEN